MAQETLTGGPCERQDTGRRKGARIMIIAAALNGAPAHRSFRPDRSGWREKQ